MESPSQKIIIQIEAIISLLELDEGSIVRYYRDFFKYTLGQLKTPHKLHEIAENILKAYGGMGTLNDIILYHNGEILDEENSKFSELITALFLSCEEVITNQRRTSENEQKW